MGCWKDSTPRAVPHGLAVITGSNHISECLKLAKDRGFELFSLQHGNQCFGGYGGANYTKYGKSIKCNDLGTGGNWANQVYRIQG